MPFVLGIKVESDAPLGREGRKWLTALRKELLQNVAFFWLAVIFSRHAELGQQSKYVFEKRNDLYANFIKKIHGQGAGKSAMLQFSGRSMRFMKAGYKITGTAGSATVSMRPPSYFTNPFIGSFTDPKSGKVKRITRQPDKVDEVLRRHPSDDSDLRDYANQRAQELIRDFKLPTVTTVV